MSSIKQGWMVLSLFLAPILSGPSLRAQSPSPGVAGADPLEELPGATAYEKLEKLYAQGSLPASPEELDGWYPGRWVESPQSPEGKGTILGIEKVPAAVGGEPAADVRILSTWSDDDPRAWDEARPEDLVRMREMLRRGPRNEVIVLDRAEKAAVVLGYHPEGVFRYSYGIRRVGAALVIRFDYERRKISYGYFFKRIAGS